MPEQATVLINKRARHKTSRRMMLRFLFFDNTNNNNNNNNNRGLHTKYKHELI